MVKLLNWSHLVFKVKEKKNALASKFGEFKECFKEYPTVK